MVPSVLVDKVLMVEQEEAVVHLDKVDKQLNLAHLVNQVLMVMVTMVVLILTKHQLSERLGSRRSCQSYLELL